MRWPWQRERPATTTPSREVPGQPAVAPMGWAFLPPLQRTLADPTLVSRPHDFPRMLPAWRDPSFASHELTHVVSPAAPSGVIDGDGTGSPHLRYEPTDLTLLTPTRPAVQRAVAAHAVPSAPAVAAPARSLTRTSTASLPVLQLAAVETPEATVDTHVETPVEPPESVVPSDPEPLEPLATSAPDVAGPPSAPFVDASDTVDDPPTRPDRPLLGADPEAGLTAGRTDAATAPIPAVQRSAAPEGPRRYGLGAPLRTMPSHSVEPTAHAESTAHDASPSEPQVQRAPEDHAPADTAPADTAPTDTAQQVSVPITANASPDGPAVPATPTAQRHVDHAAGAAAPDEHGDPPLEVQTGVAPEPPAAPGPTAMPLAHDGRQPSADDMPVHSEAAPEATPAEAAAADPSGEPTVDAPTLQGGDLVTVPEETTETPATTPASPPPPAPPPPPVPMTLARSHAGDSPPIVDPVGSAASIPHVADGPAPSTAAPLTRPLLGLQRSDATTTASRTASSDAPTSVARTPVRAAGTVQRSLAVNPSTGVPASAPVSGRDSGSTLPSTAEAWSSGHIPTISRSAVEGRSAGPQKSAAGFPEVATVHSGYGASRAPTAGLTVAVPVVSRVAEAAHPVGPAPRATASLLGVLAPAAPSVLQRKVSSTSAPTADLPLARAPEGDAATPATAESPSTPALEPTFEPTVPVTVSRALQTGATEVPIQNAEAAPVSPTAAQPSGAPAGAASSPEDVEALAQKLIGPMMRRIRAEMLLDRERRGLRTDRRR